jgi:hypothetical protein
MRWDAIMSEERKVIRGGEVIGNCHLIILFYEVCTEIVV